MQTTVPTGDDVVAVPNLLDQMTSLLQMELEAENEAMSSNVSNQCHTRFTIQSRSVSYYSAQISRTSQFYSTRKYQLLVLSTAMVKRIKDKNLSLNK